MGDRAWLLKNKRMARGQVRVITPKVVLGGLSLLGQVGEQHAEVLGNLRAKHAAEHSAQRAFHLNHLTDSGFGVRGLDPAVEAKRRTWHDARLEREAAARHHVDEAHLVMLAGPRVHDPGGALSEPT